MAVEKGSCHSTRGSFLGNVPHLHKAPARWVLAPGQSFGKNSALKKNLTPLSSFFQGCPYRLAQLFFCSSWGWPNCIALLTGCLCKVCGIALSRCPVWPVAICRATGGDSRNQPFLVLGSASCFPSPEQQPKQLVLLSFPSYLPSHVVQHLLFPTHSIWADGPAAQKELRKSNFSLNWCLPAFLSYVPPLNIPFFFPLPLQNWILPASSWLCTPQLCWELISKCTFSAGFCRVL